MTNVKPHISMAAIPTTNVFLGSMVVLERQVSNTISWRNEREPIKYEARSASREMAYGMALLWEI